MVIRRLTVPHSKGIFNGNVILMCFVFVLIIWSSDIYFWIDRAPFPLVLNNNLKINFGQRSVQLKSCQLISLVFNIIVTIWLFACHIILNFILKYICYDLTFCMSYRPQLYFVIYLLWCDISMSHFFSMSLCNVVYN